ncbi:MAG: purine-nucleoside phosphorylase [Caldilineaceae bacterium SB0664_bin_27]|uniref:Purine nucleoside phosphorylase n=1 Tax=Caldilineaceae bacterium SB0664_bin_27 TaxID=2605260 RepID=A0A6B0YUD1_9CHLR|nr:purine-nucleoside phosphorylase [Caldilineaceae bacterium SB0664_bin_27]
MSGMFGLAEYDRAAAFVRERANRRGLQLVEGQPVGLVLGSGLNSLAEAIEGAETVQYEEIPHFPSSTAPGHEGRLIVGQLAGRTVVAMQGRFHYYEGYSAGEITFPIRVMKRLGVGRLILTNAAGGVNPAFRAGDLMLIVDHLNFVGMAGQNPLIGPNAPAFGTRFPSMTHTYARSLRKAALASAQELRITLRQGVYAFLAGPNFETPAEVRYLRLVGADAVGMSTVPEALVAVHAGIEVLGISTITNVAVDQLDSDKETSAEEVMETGGTVVPQLTALLTAVLRRM